MLPLLKTGEIISKRGGQICLAKRETGCVARQFDRDGVRVRVFDQYPCFSNSRPPTAGSRSRPTIDFSGEVLDALEQIDPAAKDTLFELAFDFERQQLAGKSESDAYAGLAAQFAALSSRKREACLRALRPPEIDPDNTFANFLQASAAGDDEQQQRFAALLRARRLIDVPYDRARASEVERQSESDLPTLRLQTLDVLANTYDSDVDRRNANRVFRHCLDEGKRLLVCRFGRAFYTDALLIANAKGVKSDGVARELADLDRQSQRLTHPRASEQIGPEVQRVLNLGRQPWFPRAGIEGALEKLKESLRALETESLRELDTTHDFELARQARERIDRFRAAVYRLEDQLAAADQSSPCFVTFVSRIHELDAVNVVRVNELLDPFFGENPQMGSLITATADNSTISPNPHAWLPYASDWVEALPAYAHYTIVPSQTGYEVVAVTEREILEIVYKTCADDWARNIEDVMAREHVGVARWLVAGRYEASQKIDAPADDQAVIDFIRRHDLGDEVARVAVLVEQTAAQRHRDLARLQQEGRSREDALFELCAERTWTARNRAADKRISRYRLMALENKRPLPTVHVLTTLGPTETETNITNWLEEAMALFVIVREQDLQAAVETRLAEYRQRVGEWALQAVRDEELEGELLRMADEQGLVDQPDYRAQLAISLATTYPEIAARVNRAIADALDNAGQVGHGLRDFVGPLATFTARRAVVRERGLAHLLDDNRYRYASSGPFKRYHLAYTPSRVDLGPDIIQSVRNVPKWVGGDGRAAAHSARSLYALFNVAGVTAVDRPRIAEFLKVGENFFTRGGVFYLSLAAGANLTALGVGDFEFLRSEWNRRGDRTVLPTGETYGGFCVPKEFSLLFAIVTRALNPETTRELLDHFGIPRDDDLRERLLDDLLHVLKLQRKTADPLAWEEQAAAYLSARYPEYLPRLTQLTTTLHRAGVLHDDPESGVDFEIANWKNKKALGLEEINRSGVFDKVRLIHRLAQEAARDNPDLSFDQLTGVMGAGYKEDVTDVRFSAGARKLEVFAGLWPHLLEDIDPDGRTLYTRVLTRCPPPRDIRLVGRCTAKDLFGHVPMDFSPFAEDVQTAVRQAGYSEQWLADNADRHGLDVDRWNWRAPADRQQVVERVGAKLPLFVFGHNLGQISESVRRRFVDAGLADETIDANAYTYGGDVGRWKGLDEQTKQRLIREIGPVIHVLVTEARGVFGKERYEAAVSGADFLDLGIPDQELLDLIDNLPKLVYLMRRGADKPLLFADGTSGARRFAMGFRYASAEEKVKELFALGDHIHYGCLGIGREEIARWRREMHEQHERGRALLTGILERRFGDAREALRTAAARLADRQADDAAIRQEIAARQFGVWKPYYRYASQRISAVIQGLPLEQLDFGTFLLLGGRWLLSGVVSEDELEQTADDFRFALKQESVAAGTREIVEHCFRPKYVPEEEEFQEVSTGVSGSLKAVEELGVKLQTREIRRQQLEQARRLHRRRQAFRQEMETPSAGMEADYARAIERIGLDRLTEEDLGGLLALTRKVWEQTVTQLVPDDAFRDDCLRELDSTLRGGELLDAEYTSLAGKGARMFDLGDRTRAELTVIARALELLDLAYLVERMMAADEGLGVWKAVAKFFDVTINNHIFDYLPYHYHAQRTPAFRDWSREELLAFAVHRHARLHALLVALLRNRTDLAGRSPQEQDLLVGRFDSDGQLQQAPLGVDVDSAVERKWFSYARLRDLATLVFDGYPLPEIEQDYELPDAVNVGIIYPIGNTTVCVALEQGPRLRTCFENRATLPLAGGSGEKPGEGVDAGGPSIAQSSSQPLPTGKGVNLFLAPFPQITETSGQRVLTAREIFFRESHSRWVLARLRRPAVVHAVWFHFTHFLRPVIELVGAPIIQPVLWEAATYLKCALPEMMQGSGYRCPDQRNWYRRQSTDTGPEKAREQIEGAIRELAARHRVLIVKAEKESGGRRARILPVQDKQGTLLDANVATLAELVQEIAQTDNAVIQEVVPSHVRRLYTPEFLDLVEERFITELGIGVQDDTPLYSYFRLVVVKPPDGRYRITHGITVVSTAGIANVGQGGRLFEYRDEKIDPLFRRDLRDELQRIALASLKSQERYIAAHRHEILDSYREVHRQFTFEAELLQPHTNRLGVADHEILFEMGDYMPVLLVDDQDRLQRVYDHEHEEFLPVWDGGRANPELAFEDARGQPLRPPLTLFSRGRQRRLFWRRGGGKKHRARSLTAVKIECNPGAGLWRPHNDRLKLVGRDGEGVYQIFEALGEWGKRYRQQIT